MRGNMPRPEPQDNSTSHAACFATTHWSVVITAANRGDGLDSQVHIALSKLCQTYWYPLYAYLRRRGYNEHDAQDLVQGFFAQLLRNEAILRVDRQRGKFRSFLLASLNHFLADQRDHARALKRGGGKEVFSIDETDAEGRYRLEPKDERTPDQLFERRWAMTVLEQVLSSLEKEFAASGKNESFAQLKFFLLGDKTHGTYAEAAARLDTTEAAIKMSVQRLRKRYRELFRETIAQTVVDPDAVNEEIRHLMAVLGG